MRVAVYVDNIDLFTSVDTHKITMKNRHKGDIWLAEIDGITNRNQSEPLKGTKFYVSRSALPDLADDEIYHVDLVGMTCVTENGETVGTVEAVENFGASDLLDIKPANGDKNYYLSYDDKTVLQITDVITVSLPDVI